MELQSRVYLDYAATTPLDDQVLEAMLPYFREDFGNPSSVHYFGQRAEAALDEARQTIAERLNARPNEIIFTSGGSESDNLALRGVALAQRARTGANHIIISPVEHPAVLATARQLEERFGFEVDVLPVDSTGLVDPQDVEASLRPETALVSVIYANNEIGTINPIAEIGQICRQHHVPFHSDAVQAAAHLPMSEVRDSVDLLSIGAHKFYGPKGVGALFVRRGTPIIPVQTGGSHENGLRAGTSNVPLIVGMAEAFRLAQDRLEEHNGRVIKFRDRVIETVLQTVPRSRLTGHPTERLPNHASFVFEGVDGNTLLMLLDAGGFACSSGSACKVGSPKPSEVLEAVGLSRHWALGSLRVTLGRPTNEEDVEGFLAALPKAVEQARALAAV